MCRVKEDRHRANILDGSLRAKLKTDNGHVWCQKSASRLLVGREAVSDKK